MDRTAVTVFLPVCLRQLLSSRWRLPELPVGGSSTAGASSFGPVLLSLGLSENLEYCCDFPRRSARELGQEFTGTDRRDSSDSRIYAGRSVSDMAFELPTLEDQPKSGRV